MKQEDLKEDLPQPKTFKKRMKKLKVWGFIITVAIFAAVAIGYKIGGKPKNDLLTLKTIVKTFEKQGVILRNDKSKSPEDFELNGVKPAIFSIGDKRDTLLVYTFKSFVERENVIMEADKFNNPYSIIEQPFNARNALIVYMTSQDPITEEDMKSIYETKLLISDTIFKDLNGGKEIVYKGQSDSWEGTFTIKYYEHWWQDETGTLKYESYHNESPTIKYKMSDIEAVGPINFEYKTSMGGGNSTGMEINKEGYARLGNSGGSGTFPRESEDINFKVMWNGKEESIVLKAQ